MTARRILVIEDDHDIRESLAEVLTDASYEPYFANNGREALEKLRGEPEKPSAVLLDLMMPVMDGREFRELQLADPALRDIPVVLLTAHANQNQAMAGMGAVRYVRKPVDLDVLLQCLAEICGKT